MNERVAIDDDAYAGPGKPPCEYRLAGSTWDRGAAEPAGTGEYRSGPNGYVVAAPEPLGLPGEVPVERPEGLASVGAAFQVGSNPALPLDIDGAGTPVVRGEERCEDRPPVGDSDGFDPGALNDPALLALVRPDRLSPLPPGLDGTHDLPPPIPLLLPPSDKTLSSRQVAQPA
jgi:hypothetical protein